MSDTYRRLIGVGAMALTILLVTCGWGVVHSQPAEKHTLQWPLTIDHTHPWDVTVVDTAGVCLYVINAPGTAVAITAISKATLPSGTGCQ